MHPIEAFIRNPVKVSVGVLLLALFGAIALLRMPMQLTPEVTIPTLMHLRESFGDRIYTQYGFKDAFNLSYSAHSLAAPAQPGAAQPGAEGWFDDQYLAIDQGPILLMIENYRSGFVWDLLKRSRYVTAGLRKAGFTGGWLDAAGAVARTKAPRAR